MRDYKKTELYPNGKMLSSTQVLDYAKNPRQFYKTWCTPVVGEDGSITYGERMFEGKALIFGQIFSEAFADRKFDYRSYCIKRGVEPRLIDLVDRYLPMFPTLPKKDCEYELKVKYRGWTIRITLDGISKEQGVIIENKTGKTIWNQSVCDSHPQLDLQQWGYWKKYKKLARYTMLYWLDTDTASRQVFNPFKTKRTVAMMKEFEARVIDPVIDGLEEKNFKSRVVSYL